MKVYLHHEDEIVVVRARAESENGSMIGDLIHEVRSGERLGPFSYAELCALGEGEHEIFVDS